MRRMIVALLALCCVNLSFAQAQQIINKPRVIQTSGVGLRLTSAGGASTYVGPISGNTILPTSLNTTGQQEQSQILQVRAPGGITDIQIASTGRYIAGNYLTETAIGADYTKQCSVRPVGGAWTAITTGGSASPWTVTAGTALHYSDLTPFVAADGASLELWCREVGASLPQFNPSNARALALDEGMNRNAGSTTIPKTVTDSDGTRRYRDASTVAILGTRTGDSVAVIGDSQQAFASTSYLNSDDVPASHNRGDIPNTLAASYAVLNDSVGGDQYSTWLYGDHTMQVELARKATIIVTQKGINEFNNKGALTGAVALAWAERSLPIWNGKKVIAATLAPRTTFANTTAVFTGSTAAGTLTVTAMTSGTIYPGMGLSTSGGPAIIAQLTGTPGGVGTYSITLTTTIGSTSITGTGANIAADGSDQTLASYSTQIPVYNSGLTFGGKLAAPLDRFTVTQNTTTVNKVLANGTDAYRCMRDGLHLSTYCAYTAMATNASAWAAQLAALTPGTYAQPAITFSTTSPTYAGGYATGGTYARNDVFPGNGQYSLIVRFKVAATQSAQFIFFPNLTNPYVKTGQVNASGQIVMQNGAGTTYATSASVRDGTEHELCIGDNGITQGAALDGTSFGSATYAHPTNAEPALSLVASSVATTSFAIREVTLWNYDRCSTTYTPALFNGNEAGLIGLWHLATDATGTIGPALPQ